MNTQRPIEAQQDFIDLAYAVANALEHPACPEPLRDALNDSVVNELIDLFSSDNIALLRALAGLAEPRDGKAKPEGATLAVAKSQAKAAALNGAS